MAQYHHENCEEAFRRGEQNMIEKVDELKIEGGIYWFIDKKDWQALKNKIGKKEKEESEHNAEPECKKEHPEYVRTYTKEWKLVNGEETCPLICDKCNVIWYEDKKVKE